MAPTTPTPQPHTYFERGYQYTDYTLPSGAIVTTVVPPHPLPPMPQLDAALLEPFDPDPVAPVGECDESHCYCDNPHRCRWHR